MDILTSLLDLPLIGILRGFAPAQLPGIVRAVVAGGLRHLEITMNSDAAARQIKQVCELSGGRLNIGAGTVTSVPLLEQALGAGAAFVVTPAVRADVIRECVRRGVPVMPGAMSPSEILSAWEMGAAMVKVFPADAGGPGYLRALRAPFPEIRLLPTGGVDLESARDYLAAGAAGLGVGGPLFDRGRIDAGDWAWLEDQTRRFTTLVVEAKNPMTTARICL